MNQTGKRIYLDHAATTAVRTEVVEAMLPCFTEYYGNPSSFYREGHEAAGLIQKARETIAAALKTTADEIFFTSCGSESDNWAIKGAAIARQARGKHLITSKIEHHAVIHTMEFLEKQGFEVTWLDVDADGKVDPQAVADAIREDTILVSIMMANNEIGTIQPIAEIGRICRAKSVLFHSDAVQALGAIPIDLSELPVDLMSFSGHKLYAPKGIGFLYLKKGLRIEPFIHGGAQEKGRRAGTENTPYIVGLAKAVELAVAELTENSVRFSEMRDYLIREIKSRIPHARLNGHATDRLPNNVNFSFEFIEGESILLLLDNLGYDCSSGSACTSGSLDPSHVLLAIGLPHEIAHGSLRISLGRENKLNDLEAFVQDLPVIVQRLRDMSPLYADYLKGRVNSLIPE